MSDLPARLEAAEGSPELDIEVLWAAFRDDLKTTIDGVRHVATMIASGDFRFIPLADRHDCPRYTTCAGVALSLVDMTGHPLWTMTTETWSYGQNGMAYTVEITIPSRKFRGHSSAGLPLAICAAALRARLG
jgi:hypothetical protein